MEGNCVNICISYGKAGCYSRSNKSQIKVDTDVVRCKKWMLT